MSDAVKKMIDDVLRPLLEADGATIELVTADDKEVIVSLGGSAAFEVGNNYVKDYVVGPALRKAAPNVTVIMKNQVPRTTKP